MNEKKIDIHLLHLVNKVIALRCTDIYNYKRIVFVTIVRQQPSTKIARPVTFVVSFKSFLVRHDRAFFVTSENNRAPFRIAIVRRAFFFPFFSSYLSSTLLRLSIKIAFFFFFWLIIKYAFENIHLFSQHIRIPLGRALDYVYWFEKWVESPPYELSFGKLKFSSFRGIEIIRQ